MERDTLRDYLGKMVKIKAREGREGYPTYVGKVSNYDFDFVTLNPFVFETKTSNYEIRKLAKFDAGTTDRQITIGRRCIDSIKELVIE